MKNGIFLIVTALASLLICWIPIIGWIFSVCSLFLSINYIRKLYEPKKLGIASLVVSSLSTLLSTLIGVVLCFILIFADDVVEEDKKENTVSVVEEEPPLNSSNVKEKMDTELKVAQAKEETLKKEEEERLKVEKQEKQEAEVLKLNKEKETKTYVNDVIKNQINAINLSYDSIWEEGWTTTMTGISDGTVDQYEAYAKMKIMDTKYGGLLTEIEKLESYKDFDSEEQKMVTDYKLNMKNAVLQRQLATNTSKEMFNTMDYSPKKLDEVLMIVQTGDAYMMKAAMSITVLLTKYE